MNLGCVSLIFFGFVLCIGVSGRQGEVCFPFGNPDTGPAPLEPSQGRPGKIGPPGPQGQKGDQGPIGPNGECPCPWDPAELIRNELQKHKPALCGVGMRDGRVKNEDITASSTYSATYRPIFARLDHRWGSGTNGAWLACTTCKSPGEWIQVDLREATRLTGVVTQGRHTDSDGHEFVKSYKISYGNSTSEMQTIQSATGVDLIFKGNVDIHSYAINEFPSPIVARFVRLIVQSWNRWASIRLEYLTC